MCILFFEVRHAAATNKKGHLFHVTRDDCAFFNMCCCCCCWAFNGFEIYIHNTWPTPEISVNKEMSEFDNEAPGEFEMLNGCKHHSSHDCSLG
jgi:hypothetical protein